MSGYSHKHVFAAACLGILVFGIVITVLGTILPSLIERFAVDKTAAGSSITLLSVGVLLGSLVFGPVVDRYGFKGLLIASSAFVLVGLEALAFATDFDMLRAAVLFVGFGGGVINGGANALVSDISAGQRGAGLSLLGVFFGIGAFGVPLVVGLLLDQFSYTALTAFVGLPVAAALVYFASVSFPEPKQPQSFPVSKGRELLRDPAILLLGAMLFVQSGIEMTAGGWASTYFQEEFDAAPSTAAFGLSLFWVGITAARLVLGGMLKKSPPDNVLRAFILLALAGSVVLIAAEATWLGFAGIFLMGAGLAAGFPVGLAYAGDLHPHVSGTTFSVLFVMALSGGSLLPLVVGWLGNEFSLRVSFVVTPVGLIVMLCLLQLALPRIVARMDDAQA